MCHLSVNLLNCPKFLVPLAYSRAMGQLVPTTFVEGEEEEAEADEESG